MVSSDPHVAVVVDKTDETEQFFASLRLVHVLDGFDFRSKRLNARALYPVAEIVEFAGSEQRLLGIDRGTC